MLLAFIPLGAVLGADGAPPAMGYAETARAAALALRRTGLQRDLPYAVAATAITATDLVLRKVFVSDAQTGPLDPHSYFTQVKETIALAGTRNSFNAYLALGVALLVLVLLAPRVFGPEPQQRVRIAWIVSLFAVFAALCSAGFALLNARSDLVFLPLYFYALFLCAAALLLLELAKSASWPRIVAVSSRSSRPRRFPDALASAEFPASGRNGRLVGPDAHV